MPTSKDVIERDKLVRRSGPDYVASFLDHLPWGIAWDRDYKDSVFYRVCVGLANFWGYVDNRAADFLVIECDPRKTHEMLTDWERNWGLPDPCFPDATSEEDRRKMLVLVMTLLGGQSRAFYQKIANWVGYDLEITELAPYMCGVSEVGDTVGEYDDTTNYRWYLGSEEIRFAWSIRADEAVLKWFRVGEGGGECGVDHHLEIYVESPLDCLLQRWKPAHTELVFDYQGSLDAGEIAS
jgi:uncharacterized protein YmfQ (DUF2313 family)